MHCKARQVLWVLYITNQDSDSEMTFLELPKSTSKIWKPTYDSDGRFEPLTNYDRSLT